MGGNNHRNRRERGGNVRPRTRGAHPKLSDPVTNTNLLNARLKSLGLYAAPTLGDGNCLFRALSDQLYGSHAKHLELRQEICDFIESRKEEYAPFIDDEKGIDAHLKTMRRPGEYGGHVELSVFARLKRRDVKVIQPDVCYVIEHKHLFTDDDELEPSTSNGPARRKNPEPTSVFAMTEGTIYVAYHDWEHFSSVRNIKGPHHGLPKIQEQPAEPEEEVAQASKQVKVTISKHKLKAMRGKVPTKALLSKTTPPKKTTSAKPAAKEDSRDSSPLTSLSETSEVSGPPSGSGSSAPSSLAPVTPPDGHDTSGQGGMEARLRSRLGVDPAAGARRSPKRSLAESDADGGSEDHDGSVDGRRLRRKGAAFSPSEYVIPATSPNEADEDDEENKSVLKLLGEEDDDSDSSLSPPPPDPREVEASQDSTYLKPSSQASYITGPPSTIAPSSRPSPSPYESSSQDTTYSESASTIVVDSSKLTRRQRRTLGLPKHGNGSERVTKAGNVIVIPGGRHPSRLAMRAAQERQKLVLSNDKGDEDKDQELKEWEKNGSGRKDARGFVVLNI